MRAMNQKGEGKAGLLFGLTVLAITIFLAWKIVPVMIHAYAFEDKFREQCKFLRGRNVEVLRADIVKDAQSEELPVTADDVDISRANQVLKATVNYTVPIDLAVYTYPWQVSLNYEAPIFE
jgi:hypothetical protein